MNRPITISGKTATLEAEVNGYRVTVTITPVADKPLDERVAKLALTAVLPQFPQMVSDRAW